jgi:hypothetical protein
LHHETCHVARGGRHAINKDEIFFIDFFRLPAGEVRANADDPRPIVETPIKMLLEFLHEFTVAVKVDHIRVRKIGVIVTHPMDGYKFSKPSQTNAVQREQTVERGDLDPDAECPKVTCGDDRHAPVAAAQVEEYLTRFQVRKVERGVDPFLVRRHPGNPGEDRDEEPEQADDADHKEEDLEKHAHRSIPLL